MKCPVKSLDNQEVSSIDLAPEVFGVEVRADLLAQVVNWQLAKRRSGNHKTKGISEIRGSSQKPVRQKGRGKARVGSWRSAQFRGGATIFGPVVRSHAYSLPKKVRRLALRSALSSKCADQKLLILDAAHTTSHKTKDLSARLAELEVLPSALIITGETIDNSFRLAARNIPRVDVLAQQGTNVYDILRHDMLLLTVEAVHHLEARLK